MATQSLLHSNFLKCVLHFYVYQMRWAFADEPNRIPRWSCADASRASTPGIKIMELTTFEGYCRSCFYSLCYTNLCETYLKMCLSLYQVEKTKKNLQYFDLIWLFFTALPFILSACKFYYKLLIVLKSGPFSGHAVELISIFWRNAFSLNLGPKQMTPSPRGFFFSKLEWKKQFLKTQKVYKLFVFWGGR